MWSASPKLWSVLRGRLGELAVEHEPSRSEGEGREQHASHVLPPEGWAEEASRFDALDERMGKVEALLRAVLHVVQQRGAGHAFTATT